jgi:hypothetical protein
MSIDIKTVEISQRIAWRLKEVSKLTGLSENFLRKEICARKLHTQKLGRCVVILDSDLHNYLRGNKNENN